MSEARTQAIARYVAEAREVPVEVRQHAERTLLNSVGCAIGGASHEAVASASRALLPFSGGTTATVMGRNERADPMLAALINGMSAAVYSFDDTHAEAVVHPGGPVACAMLAFAETRPISGKDFLLAYALGIEVVCRVSKAVSVPPAINEPGWIQTGITAGIGAAAAVGKLLGLDQHRMAAALGIAVSQAGGLRSLSLGMCFSFMSGQAAQVGLRSALLAEQGFTSAQDALAASGGFLDMYSNGAHAGYIDDGLGTRFELLKNTFKPYPCGVVIHPAIDAALEVLDRGTNVDRIEAITIKLNPVSVRLGNNPEPSTPQESQMSIQHWVAAALIDNAAGVAQGRAEKLTDPRIAALRSKVRLEGEDSLSREAARIEVAIAGGEAVSLRINHCRGSAGQPMTDQDLRQKFRGQCESIGTTEIDKLLDLCSEIETLDDMSVILRAAAGSTRASLRAL